MPKLQLHEDSASAEYTVFPVIELDMDALVTSGAQITWSAAGDGSAVGYITEFVNSYIIDKLTDPPRTMDSPKNIMQNRNIWTLQDGAYKRENTILTAVPVGTQPSDYANTTKYFTLSNTTITVEGQNYTVYYPQISYMFWSSSEQYYRDDSTLENRLVRKFFTDNGLAFTVGNCSSYTARYTGFTALGGGNYSIERSPHTYWTVNGTFFNIRNGTTNATGYEAGLFNHLTQGAYNFLNPNPVTNFFIHFSYNDKEYYGLAVCLMSDESETATVNRIKLAFFESEYWGDSIIPDGQAPEGDFGPDSGQQGAEGGTWDYSTDTVPDIPLSYLPSALVSGSVLKCYSIANTYLNYLAERLYNSNSNLWVAWENRLYSPSSALVALHYLPVEFSGSYDSANLSIVSMAGLQLDAQGSYNAVLAYPQNDQWRDSPTYTLSVPAIAANYADYTPYTKMALHIPFCGVMEIDPATVTGGTITVRFRCDVVTGNVSARVKTTDRFGATSVIYASGNCAYTIPIMGKTGGAIGGSVVGGLVGSGVGLATMASGNLLTGGAMTAAALAGMFTGYMGEMATKATGISPSGDISPALDLSLWLEISRAVESSPQNRQSLRGVPANITMELSQLSGTGYARIADIHLDGIENATSSELQEIETLLKSGVIF